MERRYLHLCGTIAAVSLALMWLPLFVRNLPLPQISSMWLVPWFLGSILLSIVAGYKASRWWFLVTACFGLTLTLFWIGGAVWEYGARPH
jgi:hypothetical protein